MSEEEVDGYSLDTELVGQLTPVLLAKHGETIDGFHRLADNPNWKKAEWNMQIDTPLKLAVARLSVNTNRRVVGAEEKSQRLDEIYLSHHAQYGYYPSTELVAGWLGRSKAWVWKYLPDSFKDQGKVEAGESGGRPKGALQRKADVIGKIVHTTIEIEAKVSEIIQAREMGEDYQGLMNELPNGLNTPRFKFAVDSGKPFRACLAALNGDPCRTDSGVEDRLGEESASASHAAASVRALPPHPSPQSPPSDSHVGYKARCEELETRVKALEVECDTWRFKAETSGKLAEDYYKMFNESALGQEVSRLRGENKDARSRIEGMAMRITSMEAELNRVKSSPPSSLHASSDDVNLSSNPTFTCMSCRSQYLVEKVKGNLVFNPIKVEGGRRGGV